MPTLRIAGRWALMALPKRVLVRQLHDNADELAELRDTVVTAQREANWLRAELIEADARARAAIAELVQAEAELGVVPLSPCRPPCTHGEEADGGS